MSAKDVDAKLSTKKSDECEIWKQYFEGLFNGNDRRNAVAPTKPGTRVTSFEEAEQMIKREEDEQSIE